MNTLFYGDNLEILRERVPSESVDLVYLDPPFNSNRSYNVLFKTRSGKESAAQIQAFDDTWTWSDAESGVLLDELTRFGRAPRSVCDTLLAFEKFLGKSDMLAYLVMMTARLVELHRVLKRTGSLYLHCDPTASHYLKVILDTIFGQAQFRNEIVWQRTSAHSDAHRWGPNSDSILFYSKSTRFTWNAQYVPHSDALRSSHYQHVDADGRQYTLSDLTAQGTRNGSSGMPWRGFDPALKGNHWKFTVERLDELDATGRIYWPKKVGGWPRYIRYLDELKGVPIQSVWTDIAPVNAKASERLGYPTQKPLALLERIIAASSNPDDVVLDAFCGCGTAIDAAQRLGRQWVGIDITILAIDLIKTRLQDTYGDHILSTFQIAGTPKELEAAERMWKQNPFEFERWAVTLVEGEPNVKQVGDRGIDGVIRFAVDQKDTVGEALVSVKGGHQLNPGMVRDLTGTVSNRNAEMGILLTLAEPTRGMIEAARSSGVYVWPFNQHPYPKAQILTIGDLLDGRQRPNIPPMTFRPYLAAQRHRGSSHQQTSFA